MKWSLIESTSHLHYWKMEKDDFAAELKYNDQAKSFRLTAGDRRLFFIEKTGFLHNKYLLKTEYSIITGEIFPVKDGRSGMVTIDNKKFNYFQNNNLLELSSKKENFYSTIEVDGANHLNPSELFALLFSSLKVLTKSLALKPALA